MTALSLFDSDELPDPILLELLPKPEPVYRAYCPWCQDFGVSPEDGRCMWCDRPKVERYEYVEIDEDEDD